MKKVYLYYAVLCGCLSASVEHAVVPTMPYTITTGMNSTNETVACPFIERGGTWWSAAGSSLTGGCASITMFAVGMGCLVCSLKRPVGPVTSTKTRLMLTTLGMGLLAHSLVWGYFAFANGVSTDICMYNSDCVWNPCLTYYLTMLTQSFITGVSAALSGGVMGVAFSRQSPSCCVRKKPKTIRMPGYAVQREQEEDLERLSIVSHHHQNYSA